MESKEEAKKSAKENWQLARDWEKQGNHQHSNAAMDRAIEAEKCADSWLYRTFGW